VETFNVEKSLLYDEGAFLEGCASYNRDSFCELEHFRRYVKWLYTWELPKITTTSKQYYCGQHTWLIKGYGLACRVQDPRYQNALIGLMLRCARNFEDFPAANFVSGLYYDTEGLGCGSHGRSLMVDLWAWMADMDWLDSRYGGVASQTDSKFVEDLCTVMLSVRAKPSIGIGKPWEMPIAKKYYDEKASIEEVESEEGDIEEDNSEEGDDEEDKIQQEDGEESGSE
jgi:hypothetical protein